MSDISTFVRRGQSDTEKINKLQALITPIAFAEPEIFGDKERVILTNPRHERVQTSAHGTDITATDSSTRDRFSNSYTMVPDTSSPTAYPVSNTTTGTITFNDTTKIKGGAGGLFTGTQYITIPDNSTLESELPLGLACTFKTNGTEGSLGIYCKKDESTSTNPGIYVEILKNTTADFDSDDFSSDFNLTTQACAVRVHIADGTNEVDTTITTATDLFDGSAHSIMVNFYEAAGDYDSGDYSGDYSNAPSSVADFDSGDFSSDFATTGNFQVLEVFVDGVSEGTQSVASLTGSILNSRNAIFGGRDNGGVIDSLMRGYVALFEIQNDNYTPTAVTDYHSNNRIWVSNQLNALHFVGSDESSVLADIT